MNPALASDTESERHMEQDPRPQAQGPAYLRVRLCSGPQRTGLGSWFLAVEGQDSALCLCLVCLAVAKAVDQLQAGLTTHQRCSCKASCCPFKDEVGSDARCP